MLAVLLPVAGPATAQDAFWQDQAWNAAPELRPDLHEQLDGVLSARYQTDLPEVRIVKASSTPRATLPNYMVQSLLILALLVLALVVFNLVYSSRAMHGDDDDGQDLAGRGVDFANLKVPDPEELARQGRFAEAIHALLLRALVVVASRGSRSWPRSLTSREILRDPQLPEGVRHPLGQLVQRVETHHFGGVQPLAADFERCREIFGRLQNNLPGGKQ
jgi:hypothetical protein